MTSDALRPLLPLSPSRLATFEQCGLRGKLKHLDRIPEPESAEAAVGKLAHEIMMRYAAHCLDAFLASDPARLRAEAARLPSTPAGAQLADILRAAEEIRFDATGLQHYGVEHDLAFDADGHPTTWEDAWWRGRADLWLLRDAGKQLVVKDWKTSRVVPPVSDPPPGALLDYAYAATRMLMERGTLQDVPEVITVELVFLRYPAFRSWDLTWAELEHRPRALAQAARAVLQGRFRPQLGPHCGWCVYQGQCPAWQKAYGSAMAEFRPPTSPEEARGLAVQWQLVQQRAKALETALRAWAAENGPIDCGDDGVLGYGKHPTTHVTDAYATLKAIQAEGLPVTEIWKHIGLPKATAEKLLRAAGVRGKAIAQWWDDHDLLRTDVETRFQLRAAETTAEPAAVVQDAAAVAFALRGD